MRKIISASVIFIGLMLLNQTLTAQRIWESRKGCIRLQGNLAPGYLFAQKQITAYITGDVNLFLDDRTAFFGSVWCSFDDNNKSNTGLKFNYAVFSGAEYHFIKPMRFDPYIAFTPGMGLVRLNYLSGTDIRKTDYTPVPLISGAIGFNYYIGWFFHFFVKAQAVGGQVFASLPAPASLTEMKFTAGLGWNLRIWKVKRPDKWKSKNKG